MVWGRGGVSGDAYGERLRVGWLDGFGRVPREQKMLKGHLPRVIYYLVCYYTKIDRLGIGWPYGFLQSSHPSGEVSREEKMALRGTDPESNIN